MDTGQQNQKSLASLIATGTMFTTIALFMNRASGMILQMILVRMISVDQFGLFRLAMELSSFGIMFVTFFVGGVSASSTTRVVSVHLAGQRKDRMSSAIQVSILSVLFMFGILFLLSYFAVPLLLEKVFDIQHDLLDEAIPFFRWFLLYIFLSCLNMVIAAALRSCEFFGAYSIIESTTNVLRLLLIPLLIYFGSGINGIPWGWSAAFLAGILPGLSILERYTRSALSKRNPSTVMLADLKELTNFGIPIFISTLSSTIYYSGDTLILGYYMPVKFVGIYSAALVLIHSFIYLFSGLETALFPILSAFLEKRTEGAESRILEIGYRLLCLIMFPTAAYTFMMAPYMIRFLFGPDYLDAVTPARVLTTLLVGLAAMPAGVIFLSTGRPRIIARIGVISASLNLVLNFSLIPFMGILGAATSSVISRGYDSLANVSIAQKLFNAAFPWGYAVKIFLLSGCAIAPILPTFWLFPASGSFMQTLFILIVTGLMYGFFVGLILLRSPVIDAEDKRIIRELLDKTPLKPLRGILGLN